MQSNQTLAALICAGLLLSGHASQTLAAEPASDRDSQTQGERKHPKTRDNATTNLVRLLGKNATWTQVGTLAMNFETFHTQGLAKVGETFFVSAVEVIEPTVRNGAATDSLYDFTLDRSTGLGRGWLFKFDAAGNLLGKAELTDGTKYHPGGIDYDGKYIWVSVAEYRPNSRANVYRVDPGTLAVDFLFEAEDHIGGVVHNVHNNTLHGVSWGSRRLYTWELAHRGRGKKAISSDWVPNPQFYIDYQDCHYQGVEYMLCGGVATYSSPRGNVAFGGLDLVDLRDNRMSHQVPVNLFVDQGAGPTPELSAAHNAFWAEPLPNGSMRVYFMTENDNQADLLIYEAMPWINR
jgi:hypothetical protein